MDILVYRFEPLSRRLESINCYQFILSFSAPKPPRLTSDNYWEKHEMKIDNGFFSKKENTKVIKLGKSKVYSNKPITFRHRFDYY